MKSAPLRRLLLLAAAVASDASSSLRAAAAAQCRSPRTAAAAATAANDAVAAALPAFRRRRAPPLSLGWELDALSVRGGSALFDDTTSDDDDGSDSDDGSDEYDSEDEEEPSEGEPSDDSDDESADSEEEPQTNTAAAAAAGPPVKVSVRTALSSPLLDQHLEFTASRKRTVRSLKVAISKTMRGRPPLECIRLKYHGRALTEDEETVDDILRDYDEESEDDGGSDIGEEEDAVRVSMTADIVPPVDAKFGIEFREKIRTMSTREIVEAYCANMAGMAYGQELQAREGELFDGQDEEDEMYQQQQQQQPLNENHSLAIRKNAARIQKQLESTLSEDTLNLIAQEHERVKAGDDSDGSVGDQQVVYGLVPKGNAGAHRSGRKGRTLKGGATMNVKRSLQRNLNVNWADTTRNSLLFLFFGYFGGRNSFSRTFLLLSSPLCFFIQTRPVKVAMKQLFYTMGEPPGILLSLLPAPQQAIMSLDYGSVMRGVYGEDGLEGEEWLDLELAEEQQQQQQGDEIGGGLEFDDDDDDGYDEYDESDYDGDY